LGKYFFEDPKKYENKVFKKFKSDETIEVLNGVVSIIKENKNHNKKVLGEKIKSWIISGEKSFGKVMQPIRLGLVGELKGVDVFLISEIIGKKKTVYRLELLVKKIKESL
jgi:glutamyl-tRNA synthetase